jgi:hypothetical protein
MARLHVKHLMACTRIEVAQAYPGNPYILHGVSYSFDRTATSTGGRIDEMWLFARYFGDVGRYRVELDLVWDDDTRGPTSVLPLPQLLPPVVITAANPVLDRAHRFLFLPAPGVGRYTFRLSAGRKNRPVAHEFIEVR